MDSILENNYDGIEKLSNDEVKILVLLKQFKTLNESWNELVIKNITYRNPYMFKFLQDIVTYITISKTDIKILNWSLHTKNEKCIEHVINNLENPCWEIFISLLYYSPKYASYMCYVYYFEIISKNKTDLVSYQDCNLLIPYTHIMIETGMKEHLIILCKNDDMMKDIVEYSYKMRKSKPFNESEDIKIEE